MSKLTISLHEGVKGAVQGAIAGVKIFKILFAIIVVYSVYCFCTGNFRMTMPNLSVRDALAMGPLAIFIAGWVIPIFVLAYTLFLDGIRLLAYLVSALAGLMFVWSFSMNMIDQMTAGHEKAQERKGMSRGIQTMKPSTERWLTRLGATLSNIVMRHH